MKKTLIILFMTGLTHNIQSSYKPDEELQQTRDDLKQQLIIDLQYVHISNTGESLPEEQETLMNNYYTAENILHNKILENTERHCFEDADSHSAFYIAKDRQKLALIKSGLSLYQAEDEIEKITIGEEAFSALQEKRLETSKLFEWLGGTEESSKSFALKETEKLYKKVIFFDAGLKLSQAMIACNNDLTLNEALELQNMLLQRNGINGNNDGYKELITQIQSKK